MPFIQTLASIIVVAIENKRFSLELIEQELDKKEMEMAAEMQKLLFPTNLPNDENIDVAARYESKHLVGGDYYDFLSLNDNEYFFCIADVSGKGTSAALLMSNFQAKLRANIKLAISGGQNEPRDAISGTACTLLQYPEQLKRIINQKNTWLEAFEEFGRWMSPIGMSPRRAIKEYSYEGLVVSD